MTCATWSLMLTVFINSWIAHHYYCGMACGIISFHKGWPGVSYAAAVNKGISILGIWRIQTAVIMTTTQLILSHFSNLPNWYFLFTYTLCVSSSYFPLLELCLPHINFHMCSLFPPLPNQPSVQSLVKCQLFFLRQAEFLWLCFLFFFFNNNHKSFAFFVV